jgi:hypothetical protein
MCAMSPRLLRPTATGFDPRRLANLTGWYDATDSASYTEVSGQISEWRDKSGAGNHLTQDTGNDRPTLFVSSNDVQTATRAEINGKQALFFDGDNDRIFTTNTVTSGQSRTVFAVAQRTDNATVATVAAFGSTTDTPEFRWLCRYGNSANKNIGGDSEATNQLLSDVLAWDLPHISCWSQNSGTRNLTYLLNNTAQSIIGNPPGTQTSFSGLTVGMLPRLISEFMDGTIGELIVYDRELSAAERDTVFRGLARRWGISVA